MPEEAEELERIVYEMLSKNSHNDPAKAELLKSPMKSLMSKLVDRVIQRAQKRRKSPPKMTEDNTILGRVLKKLGNSSRFNSSLKRLPRSQSIDSWATSSPVTPDAHFSEFGGRISSCKFSKSQRILDLSCDRSPGPAFYESHKSTLSKRTNSFGKNQSSRSEFLQPNDESPSPTAYSPSKSFLSTKLTNKT